LIKGILRGVADRMGYEVRKAPKRGFKPASVFDIAVQYLMLKRGESLRFIQVGANDGRFGDPLRRYILKHGWTGVLIEPQPDVFAVLRGNYSDLTDRLFFENVAISTQPGEMTLYRAKHSSTSQEGSARYVTSVASSNPHVTAKQLKLAPAMLDRVKVPAMRLDALVAKYGFTEFDLLQIDTEGHDWQVLQTLDLSKCKPLLIQFEHGHLPPRDLARAVAHLNASGYLVHYGGYQTDTLAVRNDFCMDYRIDGAGDATSKQ
jgi:FkbM family methyltransferase